MYKIYSYYIYAYIYIGLNDSEMLASVVSMICLTDSPVDNIWLPLPTNRIIRKLGEDRSISSVAEDFMITYVVVLPAQGAFQMAGAAV